MGDEHYGRGVILRQAAQDGPPRVTEVRNAPEDPESESESEPAVALKLSSITATITVEQLAEAFASLDDEAQAEFFAHMADAFAEFKGGGLGRDMQAMSIGGCLGKLSPDAVELLRTVVEYADEAVVKDVMES